MASIQFDTDPFEAKKPTKSTVAFDVEPVELARAKVGRTSGDAAMPKPSYAREFSEEFGRKAKALYDAGVPAPVIRGLHSMATAPINLYNLAAMGASGVGNISSNFFSREGATRDPYKPHIFDISAEPVKQAAPGEGWMTKNILNPAAEFAGAGAGGAGLGLLTRGATAALPVVSSVGRGASYVLGSNANPAFHITNAAMGPTAQYGAELANALSGGQHGTVPEMVGSVLGATAAIPVLAAGSRLAPGLSAFYQRGVQKLPQGAQDVYNKGISYLPSANALSSNYAAQQLRGLHPGLETDLSSAIPGIPNIPGFSPTTAQVVNNQILSKAAAPVIAAAKNTRSPELLAKATALENIGPTNAEALAAHARIGLPADEAVAGTRAAAEEVAGQKMAPFSKDVTAAETELAQVQALIDAQRKPAMKAEPVEFAPEGSQAEASVDLWNRLKKIRDDAMRPFNEAYAKYTGSNSEIPKPPNIHDSDGKLVSEGRNLGTRLSDLVDSAMLRSQKDTLSNASIKLSQELGYVFDKGADSPMTVGQVADFRQRINRITPTDRHEVEFLKKAKAEVDATLKSALDAKDFEEFNTLNAAYHETAKKFTPQYNPSTGKVESNIVYDILSGDENTAGAVLAGRTGVKGVTAGKQLAAVGDIPELVPVLKHEIAFKAANNPENVVNIAALQGAVGKYGFKPLLDHLPATKAAITDETNALITRHSELGSNAIEAAINAEVMGSNLERTAGANQARLEQVQQAQAAQQALLNKSLVSEAASREAGPNEAVGRMLNPKNVADPDKRNTLLAQMREVQAAAPEDALAGLIGEHMAPSVSRTADKTNQAFVTPGAFKDALANLERSGAGEFLTQAQLDALRDVQTGTGMVAPFKNELGGNLAGRDTAAGTAHLMSFVKPGVYHAMQALRNLIPGIRNPLHDAALLDAYINPRSALQILQDYPSIPSVPVRGAVIEAENEPRTGGLGQFSFSQD